MGCSIEANRWVTGSDFGNDTKQPLQDASPLSAVHRSTLLIQNSGMLNYVDLVMFSENRLWIHLRSSCLLLHSSVSVWSYLIEKCFADCQAQAKSKSEGMAGSHSVSDSFLGARGPSFALKPTQVHIHQIECCVSVLWRASSRLPFSTASPMSTGHERILPATLFLLMWEDMGQSEGTVDCHWS